MNSLELLPAEHGGYIVWSSSRRDYGESRTPQFAGSLCDALEFMRAHFANPQPAESISREALSEWARNATPSDLEQGKRQ